MLAHFWTEINYSTANLVSYRLTKVWQSPAYTTKMFKDLVATQTSINLI